MFLTLTFIPEYFCDVNDQMIKLVAYIVYS